MTDDRTADVTALWQAHRQALFPARRRTTEANDVELVTLDADVAGCVSAWLSNGGRLDLRHRAVLEARQAELARAEACFDAEETVYWKRLRDLLTLLLDDQRNTTC